MVRSIRPWWKFSAGRREGPGGLPCRCVFWTRFGNFEPSNVVLRDRGSIRQYSFVQVFDWSGQIWISLKIIEFRSQFRFFGAQTNRKCWRKKNYQNRICCWLRMCFVELSVENNAGDVPKCICFFEIDFRTFFSKKCFRCVRRVFRTPSWPLPRESSSFGWIVFFYNANTFFLRKQIKQQCANGVRRTRIHNHQYIIIYDDGGLPAALSGPCFSQGGNLYALEPLRLCVGLRLGPGAMELADNSFPQGIVIIRRIPQAQLQRARTEYEAKTRKWPTWAAHEAAIYIYIYMCIWS